MTNLKVLITIGKLDVGGAEMRLLRLIQSLPDGFSATIYVVSGQVGVLTDKYIEAGASIVYGHKGLFGLIRFGKDVRQIRPDVLHVNASLAGGLYCFVGWVCNIKKRISHIRTTEDYSTGFMYNLKKPLYQLMLNTFSSKVVGVCDGARRLSNTPVSKWVTVYNGFEIQQLDNQNLDLSRETVRMVVMGRMHEVKNQSFMVNVLAALVMMNVDCRLSFYGDEDVHIKTEIQNLAKSFDVAHLITFHGRTDRPLDALKQYDVLCLPSKREGLPGVVLEAASCGVPSVCSLLPGCVEIAEQLSSVKIAKSFSVEEWVEKILETRGVIAENVLKEFTASEFLLPNHISKLTAVWVE